MAAGWAVLIAAILANLIASLIGLSGWYDLAQGRSVGPISWAWMVLGYPALLGSAAWVSFRLTGADPVG